MKKETLVHQGGIYLVKEDLYIAFDMHRIGVGGRKHDACTLRKMVIPAGELLEMRYFSPAHFRDINNHYFPLHNDQLWKLEHVAEILPEVFRANIAELYDILRLSLYTEVKKDCTRHTNIAWMKRALKLKEHFDGVYTNL